MGEMLKRPCDYGKLVAALKEKGLTPNQAGVRLGYSSGAFTQPRREGVITERLVVGLNYLGIEYDQIAPDPEPKPEPAPEQLTLATNPEPVTVNVTITPDVISEALVNTMMNQEVRNQIVQIVYYAVNKAIRNNSEH